MSPRMPFFAFAASLAVHTLAVASFAGPWDHSETAGPPDNVIEIAYVQPAPPPAAVPAAAAKLSPPAPVKKSAPQASRPLPSFRSKPAAAEPSPAVVARRK